MLCYNFQKYTYKVSVMYQLKYNYSIEGHILTFNVLNYF